MGAAANQGVPGRWPTPQRAATSHVLYTATVPPRGPPHAAETVAVSVHPPRRCDGGAPAPYSCTAGSGATSVATEPALPRAGEIPPQVTATLPPGDWKMMQL